jgi:hypothetical protein
VSWSVSRTAVGIEIFCITLPVSLALLLLAGLDAMSSPWALVALPAGACLVAGWRLSLTYFSAGQPGLSASPRHDWVLVHVGAVITLCGISAHFIPWERFVNLPPEGGELPGPIPELRGFGFAAPLLLPYVHLILQRHFGTDSNNA